MKASFLVVRRAALALSFLAMVGALGCAKQDTPLPPPPPQNPNPVPGVGVPGVGNCPAPAGQPFNTTNQPYYARLYSYATGSNSNSMSVNFVFADINARPEDRMRTIGAVANMTLPDLNTLTGGYMPQYSFCVSSVDPASGVANPGTYNQQDAVISVRMLGLAQVPVFNPYAGYPGSFPSYGGVAPAQSMTPTPVEVQVEAALDQGWLYGYAVVIVGQGSYAGTYQYEVGAGSGSSGSGYGGGYGNGGYYDPYYGYYY